MERFRLSLLALLNLGGRAMSPLRCKVNKTSLQAISLRHPFGPAFGGIPFSAEDLGDLSAAFVPMQVNRILNQLKVWLSDSSFSYGNRQHFHCIAKEKRRRQQKIKKLKKSLLEFN